MKKTLELTGHAGPIYAIDFDGEFLYSSSSDKFVVRWDLKMGIQDKFAIQMDQAAYSIACFGEHCLAVGDTSGRLFIFDTNEKVELKQYTQHTKPIFSIEENQQKKQLFVSDIEGNISIWDTESFELLAYFPLDCGKIRQISFSLDGNTVAFACQDGHVRMIDVNTLNEELNFLAHSTGVNVAIFSEQRMITGGKNARLKEWDLQGKELNTVDAHNYALYDLIQLKSGEILVSASFDKSIKVWTKNLHFVEKITHKEGGHLSSVNGLVKIDETIFASCSDDKKIILWELN